MTGMDFGRVAMEMYTNYFLLSLCKWFLLMCVYIGASGRACVYNDGDFNLGNATQLHGEVLLSYRCQPKQSGDV